jgi:hypothetical protein
VRLGARSRKIYANVYFVYICQHRCQARIKWWVNNYPFDEEEQENTNISCVLHQFVAFLGSPLCHRSPAVQCLSGARFWTWRGGAPTTNSRIDFPLRGHAMAVSPSHADDVASVLKYMNTFDCYQFRWGNYEPNTKVNAAIIASKLIQRPHAITIYMHLIHKRMNLPPHYSRDISTSPLGRWTFQLNTVLISE